MNVKLLVIFILIPTISFSLTLQEMVVETINSNPLIKIEKHKEKASEKKLRQVYADYLPNLTISGNVGIEKTELETNPQSGDQLSKYDTSVILKENIFNGLDTIYGVKSRKAEVKSAGYRLEEEVNNLSLRAVTAYLNLLKASELVEIAQENVDVHVKILGKIEKKVKAGVQRQSLYDQTLSRSESAKSSLLVEKQNYENALLSFKKILDIELLSDELIQVFSEELPYENREMILKEAIKNHPAIKYSEFDIEESRANYSRAISKYLPSVDLQAEAKFRDNINGIEGENNSFSGLVVINYNLYNGGADQAVREENMQIILERRERLEAKKRDIKEKLFISWNNFDFAKKQIVHLEKYVASAGKTVKDYHKEYELGRRSLVDLLNSELEYNAAKNRLVTIQYQEVLSFYELLAHSGTLLAKFDIKIKN